MITLLFPVLFIASTFFNKLASAKGPFFSVRVNTLNRRNMVGHKLGEFVATRTYKGHKADDKKASR